MGEGMSAIVDFIWAEREWMFSGIGVVILAALFSKLRNSNVPVPQSATAKSTRPNEPTSKTEQLDPLLVTLSDGYEYQVQVLFSYRLVNPSQLLSSVGDYAKAEDMLQKALRVKLIGKLETQTYSSLASDRAKISKIMLKQMEDTASEFGFKMMDIDIGSISKQNR